MVVANEAREAVAQQARGVSIFRVQRLAAFASTPIALGLPRALRRAANGGGVLPAVRMHAEASGAFPFAPTDLLHLHFPYPWGEFSWLLAGSPRPAVLTYHSDIVRQERLLALYRPILRRVLRRVDLIIASSPDMVEHSEFLRPVAGKCRVVPFGIDVHRYSGDELVRRQAASLRAGHTRPVVLFVGRLIYYKGAEVLVRAMASVDADLVLVGSGPLERVLRDQATRLGTADRVTFLPFLEGEALVAHYHAADVFCLPSVARSEAFG